MHFTDMQPELQLFIVDCIVSYQEWYIMAYQEHIIGKDGNDRAEGGRVRALTILTYYALLHVVHDITYIILCFFQVLYYVHKI